MALTIKKTSNRKGTGTDWARVKKHWIARNLDPNKKKKYTLRNAAEDFQVGYGHLRTVAAKEEWNSQLKEAAARVAEESIEIARKKAAFDESEIRNRQYRYAKIASEKAIEKLKALDPKKLTTKEATELLRLGLVEERRATGIADHYVVQDGLGPNSGVYESPTEKMKRHKKLKDWAEQLSNVLKLAQPEEAQDEMEVPDGSLEVGECANA